MEIEYTIIIKLNLEIMLHQLVDVLYLVKCKSFEHSKTISVVKYIESCQPSKHLHRLDLASIYTIVRIFVECVENRDQ
jgi:hypothetical protein